MRCLQWRHVLASQLRIKAVLFLLQHSDLFNQPVIVSDQPLDFPLNSRTAFPFSLHVKPFLLDDLSFLVESISELLNFSLVTFELFGLCFEFRLNFNVLFSELFIFVFKLNQSVVHLLRLLGDLSDLSVFLLRGFEKLIDLLGARLMNDVEVGFRDLELSLTDDR